MNFAQNQLKEKEVVFVLIGTYEHNIDGKNRLFVPAKLRMELTGNFFVTLGVNCGHRCLTVYTAEDWQKLSENYNQLPISQKGAATSLIFMNATECEQDKQFRFTLTQNLLDFAGIKKEVMIVGRAGQAEIWDTEEFMAFESENLTPEKLLESLAALGL